MEFEDAYERVALALQGSRAYRRYRICGTRNDKKYLKLVACKGMSFSEEDIQLIRKELGDHVNVIIKHNKRRGIITVNLRELGVTV